MAGEQDAQSTRCEPTSKAATNALGQWERVEQGILDGDPEPKKTLGQHLVTLIARYQMAKE